MSLVMSQIDCFTVTRQGWEEGWMLYEVSVAVSLGNWFQDKPKKPKKTEKNRKKPKPHKPSPPNRA